MDDSFSETEAVEKMASLTFSHLGIQRKRRMKFSHKYVRSAAIRIEFLSGIHIKIGG